MRLAARLLVVGLFVEGGFTQAHAGTYQQIHVFNAHTNGSQPFAGLTKFGNKLYGATYGGGTLNQGTVFSLNPTGREAIVYSFQRAPDGANPAASLLDVGGTLYGTAYHGGVDSFFGTVFSLNPATGAETTLHYFGRVPFDGVNPTTSLVNVEGTLFGTTGYGGSGNCIASCGTVFALNPKTGAERVVYSFQGGSDGNYPFGSLISVGGLLYGTTDASTNLSFGTIFSVNPATGAEKVLYTFSGGIDGAYPRAALLNIGDKLYGTTVGGGDFAAGTVFSLSLSSGAEKVVYSFHGGNDGSAPVAGVIDVGGTLYGTTSAGGGSTKCLNGCGTVFSLDPTTGDEKVGYSFGGGSDGANPEASLIDVSGTLYGTTPHGGSNGCHNQGCGTIFGYTP